MVHFSNMEIHPDVVTLLPLPSTQEHHGKFRMVRAPPPLSNQNMIQTATLRSLALSCVLGPLLWGAYCSLLAERFESNFEKDSWYEEWGEANVSEKIEVVSEQDEYGFEPLRGKGLRIRIDKDDHYGASFQFKFQDQWNREPEEIWFRYYLRLGSDWNPERGGKLPGISATYGRSGWGGRPVKGEDGWSARGLFLGKENDKTPVGFYVYHMDMKGQYGSHWEWTRNGFDGLENNRWYCIEQYARVNTPEKANGQLRAWVDGELVFDKRDVRMRANDALRIESIWMNVYLGGQWKAKTEHHLYVDEVVISDEGPIEPMNQ